MKGSSRLRMFGTLLEGRLFLNSLKLFVCSFAITKLVYKDYNFNDFVSEYQEPLPIHLYLIACYSEFTLNGCTKNLTD